MNTFCDECYERVEGEKLDHCKSLNHNISKVLGDKDKEELKNEEVKRKKGKILYISKGKKTFEDEILDLPITNLRPITLLEDGTRMILVYLPTKSKELLINGDTGITEFSNKAYFVTAKNSIVSPKSIISINSKEIQENYQVKIFDSWHQSRWNISDLDKWLGEEKTTEPNNLYELTYATTRKYLDFENENDYAYFVLWNIGTYLYELFDAYPYNDYTGTKRAGKSKSMEFQKLMCFNAMMSADCSGSAMFRTIEGTGATILLDETEQMKNKNNDNAQQIRTLLLQGFLKDQYAVRSEGKADVGFSPITYNLFSPKSLSHINSFDDVLEDRCIQQLMLRSTDKDKLNSWPTSKDSNFTKIRHFCYRLFLDYGHEISELQEQARSLLNVSGRELQVWTPIMTMALFFEKHECKFLVNAIQEKITKSSGERQIHDEQGNKQLKVLRFIDEKILLIVNKVAELKKNPPGWMPVSEMYSRLIDSAKEYEINIEFYKQKQLTEDLHRIGFNQERKAGGYSWLISDNTVKEAKERLGMLEPEQKTLDGSQ